jgi:hypothetical protein
MNTQKNAPWEQEQPASVLGSSISRRRLMMWAALATIIPIVSAKEKPQVINIGNPSVAHRLNIIDSILRLRSSKSQERDMHRNRVLRIKMQTQEYVFAIWAKTIVLSRLSGWYNEQTQKREVRNLDFSYKISTLWDKWQLQMDHDLGDAVVMQHIWEIEQVLSKEFI